MQPFESGTGALQQVRAEGGSAQFRYPLHPASVSLARRAVRSACRLLGVTSDAAETCALAVSELMGNAVRAGFGTEIRLLLVWTPSRLRIEVCDDSPGVPRVTQADPLAESGRGMSILSQVAVSWGTKRLPHGKCVWAEMALAAV